MKTVNFNNLKDINKWKRLLFMIVFIIVSRLVRLLLILIAWAQFFMLLFTNRKHDKLLEFGDHLSRYIYDIMSFITYNSEERPFPFTHWPSRSNPTKSRKKSTLKKVN